MPSCLRINLYVAESFAAVVEFMNIFDTVHELNEGKYPENHVVVSE